MFQAFYEFIALVLAATGALAVARDFLRPGEAATASDDPDASSA